MQRKFRIRFGSSFPDNRKSKACPESYRRIQNRKWAGLFTIVVALTVCGTRAEAQQTGKVPRIGFLDSSTASGSTGLLEAFRQELGKLGWNEGKNIAIEYRFAEHKTERLPELAAELVRFKVDLIVVTETPVALAAKNATAFIPVVMTNVGDPVAAGLVASLAHPGGNVTGFSSLTAELGTKRLEILKDAVSKLTRVGVLRISGGGSGAQELQLKGLRAAGVALKLRLEEIEAQTDEQGLESAFQTAKQKQVGAIVTMPVTAFSPKESGSSSLPANTGCRLFTHRRSLSTRAVSCLTARTMLTSIGARLFMWTRS